jgi:hypothetical protein
MKEKFPLTLLILMGVFGLTSRFIPHFFVEDFNAYLRDVLLKIITSCALILGLGNILLLHINKTRKKTENWPFSMVLLVSFLITAVIGFGGEEGWLNTTTQFRGEDFNFDISTIYNTVLVPLGATMFSLLAFFMASAAFRSFRARNYLAVILLGSAFIVMLGQVPLGYKISPMIPEISQWIMEVPNTAAKRGIELGIALGILATSLKIISGIERSWLGGGK